MGRLWQSEAWMALRETWANLGRKHVSMMSAGIAFYALLSIFPGLAALISIYGLVADPSEAQRQLVTLSGVAPAEAIELLSDRLMGLSRASTATLGFELLVSVAVGLWSGMNATGMLMEALTIASDEQERRGLVRFYLVALVLTCGLSIFGLLSLSLVAAIPAILAHLPVSSHSAAVSLVRWPLLVGLSVLALAILYRFAPSRNETRWHWITLGAIGATALWILSSAVFSFYVSRFASYVRIYGPMGAVVILMMWLYLTAYVVLAGAEFDTAIARRSIVLLDR